MTTKFVPLSTFRKSSTFKIKDIEKGTKFISRHTDSIWLFDGFNQETFDVHLISESGDIKKLVKRSSFRTNYKKEAGNG